MVEAAKILRKHLNPFIEFAEPGPEIAIDDRMEVASADGNVDHDLERKLNDDWSPAENAAHLLHVTAGDSLFERLLACRTRHGLFAEHLDGATGEPWGNFVQTYSMVGLITSAIRLSLPWDAGV